LNTSKDNSASASATRRRFAYPASSRILKKHEFELVQSKAKRIQSRHFLILASKADKAESRLGLIITKKVDKRSVKRNLLRRRIREVFRLNRHKLTKQCDLVIIARKDSILCSFAEIKEEILSALKKAGLLESDD